MFNYRCFAVIRYKVLWNCTIKRYCINCTLHEIRELFIKEAFGINKTAYTKSGGKDMHLFYFAGLSVNKQFRLITDPVNVHLFSGNTFNRH